MLLLFTVILLSVDISIVFCQIDLGSLTLKQNKHGDLEIDFNQAANILGFGGDRGLDLTIGEGRFGAKAHQGALIGGERVGVDPSIGINEAEGLNFGNILNFGNNPAASSNPAGQFLTFLEKIGKFFTGFGKHSDVPSHSAQNLKPVFETKSIPHSFGASNQEIFRVQPTDDDYYHDVAMEDGAVQQQSNRSSVSEPKNFAVLNRTFGAN